MTELYCVVDESDDTLSIDIEKLPVISRDGVTACVYKDGEHRPVLIGEEASEDPNIVLRIAFRKLEHYIAEDMRHVAELHRNCSSLDQDRLTLRDAVNGLIATLDDAAGLVHKLVCSVLDNN